MARLNDFQQTFDLFSKLTNENNYTLQDALKYCDERTTPQIAKEFNQQCVEFTQRAIGFIANELHNFIAEGRDIEQSLIEYQAKTPHYIFIEVLKALNLEPPAEVTGQQKTTTVDIETLKKYLNAGFYFYPCNDDKTPICKIYSNKTIIEGNRITTETALNDFINGNGTCYTDQGHAWKSNEKIKLFAIYPNQYNLFCLDIDGEKKDGDKIHGTGTNGIKEFLNIIAKVDMTEKQKRMFENFPFNFPCYVSSPNGGIHLYFKLSRLPEKWQLERNAKDNNVTTNIECKLNKQITIAGSVKNGKRYILHGDLCNIPFIPMDLLNACCKARPKPIEKPRQFNHLQRGPQKEITPQYCIERGKNYAGHCGHNEMFASVINNFHYFYEKTQNQDLNATACKSWIMQDYDFLTWQDQDKEQQIDNTIKSFYVI